MASENFMHASTHKSDGTSSLLTAILHLRPQETTLDPDKANPPAPVTAPRVGMTVRTLKDVMARVEAAPDLTQVRRGEILSALRTLARCVGRDPGDIPAQPASLRKTLRDTPYALAGLGK